MHSIHVTAGDGSIPNCYKSEESVTDSWSSKKNIDASLFLMHKVEEGGKCNRNTVKDGLKAELCVYLKEF